MDLRRKTIQSKRRREMSFGSYPLGEVRDISHHTQLLCLHISGYQYKHRFHQKDESHKPLELHKQGVDDRSIDIYSYFIFIF